jgi:hypothetical protein
LFIPKYDFTFAALFRKVIIHFGLVVQLVRIHACHAWGREFESRPDRQLSLKPLENQQLSRGFLVFAHSITHTCVIFENKMKEYE